MGVVFHHAALSTNSFASEKIPAALSSLLDLGYLGVDFFFVLSGFIILNSHYNDAGGLTSAKAYFLKRLVRIFPPYLPVSILMLVAYVALPNLSSGNRQELSLVSSLLLLPSNNPPALSVAWTLVHEMMFYIFFLVYFVNKRLFVAAASAWVVLIVLFGFVLPIEPSNAFARVMIKPINLEFICGMICAYVWRTCRKGDRIAVALLVAGIVLLILLARGEPAERFVFGIAFSLIVLGGAMLDVGGRFSIPRTAVLLGDASYSIYLVHNPLVSITSRLVRSLGTHSSWGLMLVVGVGASVLLGVAYHKAFEKPSVKFIRRRVSLSAA